MTIQQLEYLLALHQQGSYSKAALTCHVTQPTLSMQLSKLEASFGEILIKKGKSPVEFTLLGKRVLEQAKVVLQEYYTLETIRDHSKGKEHVELVIGIIPTVSAYLIPELSIYLTKEFKNIHVKFREMKTQELIDAVQDMDVDYGILSGPLESRLRVKELFLESIKVYSHLEGEQIETKDLTDIKAWFLTDGNCFRVQMHHLCSSLEVEESSVQFEGESLGTLINMVDKNGGYTLVPEYFVKSLALSTKVKPFKGSNPTRSIIGISRKRHPNLSTFFLIEEKIQKLYQKDLINPSIIDWRL